MAHVKKYKSPALAPMLGHYARMKVREGFRRENIDSRRTPLNYAVGQFGTPDALSDRVTHLVEMARTSHEIAAKRRVRADAVVLCDWVVTRPQDCPEGLSGAFFESCLSFMQDRYGAQNVPGGFVHLDEQTPHMHVPVVPVLDGKLQASKLVSRKDLQSFHKELQKHVERDLGVHVSIELPEEQIGARKLSQLAQPDYIAARRAISAANEERRHAEQALAVTRAAASRLESEVEGKKAQLSGLNSEIEAKTERLERVRRVGDAFESGSLGAREEQARAAISALKPQVRAAEERVSRADDRIGKLRLRVGQLKQKLEQLGARIEKARASLAKIKPQARKGEMKSEMPVRAVTRQAMPKKNAGRK